MMVPVGHFHGSPDGARCPYCRHVALAGDVYRARAHGEVPAHHVIVTECCGRLVHRIGVHQRSRGSTKFAMIRFVRHALGGDQANPNIEFLSIPVDHPDVATEVPA
ncbi:MAG: hypothetical protein L3J96_02175 [Thermoplasmata archaeon]|nr:hypothetical protein [Thermoplasmata archaeon]